MTTLRWEVVAAVSLVSTLASLWLTRVVLLKLPADHLVADATGSTQGRLMRFFRNILGIVVVLIGVVLAVPGVPGQGLLTIAVGLVLLDVPGKRKLERKVLGHPRVLAAINKMRARARTAPLLAPPHVESSNVKGT